MGAMNCQRFTILSRQHLVVLGHHEYPEVKDRDLSQHFTATTH